MMPLTQCKMEMEAETSTTRLLFSVVEMAASPAAHASWAITLLPLLQHTLSLGPTHHTYLPMVGISMGYSMYWQAVSKLLPTSQPASQPSSQPAGQPNSSLDLPATAAVLRVLCTTCRHSLHCLLTDWAGYLPAWLAMTSGPLLSCSHCLARMIPA